MGHDYDGFIILIFDQQIGTLVRLFKKKNEDFFAIVYIEQPPKIHQSGSFFA